MMGLYELTVLQLDAIGRVCDCTTEEAACSLIDALTLYAVKTNLDLKHDLKILNMECNK